MITREPWPFGCRVECELSSKVKLIGRFIKNRRFASKLSKLEAPTVLPCSESRKGTWRRLNLSHIYSVYQYISRFSGCLISCHFTGTLEHVKRMKWPICEPARERPFRVQSFRMKRQVFLVQHFSSVSYFA